MLEEVPLGPKPVARANDAVTSTESSPPPAAAGKPRQPKAELAEVVAAES